MSKFIFKNDMTNICVSLLTDKVNITSLQDFLFFRILFSTNILPLRGSPVRDLMWVEIKLTPLVTKSHRDVTVTRHSANP
jgi:hypothetical protein